MKTSELTGALLDYWVARAEGFQILKSSPGGRAGLLVWDGGCLLPVTNESHCRFSTDWAIGGPIIEREQMHLFPPEPADQYADPRWLAHIGRPEAAWQGKGPTLLIAAMRAYVVSKFGDEVPEA